MVSLNKSTVETMPHLANFAVDISAHAQNASSIKQALAEKPKHAFADFSQGWNTKAGNGQQCTGCQHANGAARLPMFQSLFGFCIKRKTSERIVSLGCV